MKKIKLLIPITIQFAVRYVLRTGLLDKIMEYAQPVIVIAWEDQSLQKELTDHGVETFLLPRKHVGIHYARLLAQLRHWHLRCINTPTTSIDQRRNLLLTPSNMKARTLLRDSLFQFITMFPPYVRYLLERQKTLVWHDTNLSEYLELIKKIMPDAVFCLTPYFTEEEFLLRAAQELGVPLCTAILSFDNLTTRPYIPVSFEKYLLWNKYNEAELRRIYPESACKPVEVVGAPQFDFYYDESYLWDEAAWRKKLGLPASQPVLLFGSTGKIIAPHEEQWLYHLDKAIERGQIMGNPIILLRCHPNDPIEYWQPLINNTRHIVFCDPWIPGGDVPGKTNITRYDIEKLASTLFHCIVHINASSTMTIDGAIYDRPQIGPAYDENGKFANVARDLYLREHYLPITNSGGLDIVYSRHELILAINTAIRDPHLGMSGRQKIVKEICTFADGKCTDRVNLALHNFIKEKVP